MKIDIALSAWQYRLVLFCGLVQSFVCVSVNRGCIVNDCVIMFVLYYLVLHG